MWVMTQAVEQRGEGDGGAAASWGGHLGHGYPAAGPGACPGACPGCPHGSPGTRGLPALPNSPGLLPCPHQVITHSLTVFVPHRPDAPRLGVMYWLLQDLLVHPTYISSQSNQLHASLFTFQIYFSRFSIVLQLCMLACVHSFVVITIFMNTHSRMLTNLTHPISFPRLCNHS